MSMSTHAFGIREPDETFQKMLTAYRACQEAGVPVPEEVAKFFDWGTPDPRGLCISLRDKVVKGVDSDRLADIWTIALADLPQGITHIQFENSY